MQTYSPEEYKKKYGDSGVWSTQNTNNLGRQSIYDALANPIKGGIQNVKNIAKGVVQEYKEGGQNILDDVNKTSLSLDYNRGEKQNIGTTVLDVIGTIAKTAFSPVTQTVKQASTDVGDKLADIPSFQKFSNSKAGTSITDNYNFVQQKVEEWANKHPEAAKDLGASFNVTMLLGGKKAEPAVLEKGGAVLDSSANTVKNTTKAITTTAKNVTGEVVDATGNVLKPIESAIKDVTPTPKRIVNHQITKALDLTQGDVKNISLSTGNDVGEFVAKNNLIGKDVAETQGLVKDFYKNNYNQVRSEIGNVKKAYKPSQIPRYTDALKSIKSKIDGVPGLEKTAVEVENLLTKKNDITLSDVQRVKELMDEHFNLYKVTGDVGEGVQKQGLANIRQDLRKFIEKQVKEETGADIQQLNNNVQTARSITDAIEYRSTRGFTRSTLSLNDVALFGGGNVAGGPLTGAALVFAKRLLQSPSIQLKIAKFFNGLSKAKQATIKASLEAGDVPVELKRLAK